jgi:hypothetical protein
MKTQFDHKNIQDMKDINQNSQISDNKQTCQVNNPTCKGEDDLAEYNSKASRFAHIL